VVELTKALKSVFDVVVAMIVKVRLGWPLTGAGRVHPTLFNVRYQLTTSDGNACLAPRHAAGRASALEILRLLVAILAGRGFAVYSGGPSPCTSQHWWSILI